jgi:hypothetical protein
LRKFLTGFHLDAALEERYSHHEAREGHEDRMPEKASNLKKMFFFLRDLRVLRGDTHFLLVAALPRVRFVVTWYFLIDSAI